MVWLILVPFPVSGGKDLSIPPPDEDRGGEGDSAVEHYPWVGGGGGSVQGGVEVDAGEGEEGTGGVDKTSSGIDD